MASDALDAVLHALATSFAMAWHLFWALVLGFTLAAVVEALVRRETIVKALGDHRPRTIGLASVLGAGSSSCSYAAVALARSLVRQGADLAAAIAFQVASTNLVLELGVLLVVFLGWPFAAAEYLGGVIMIALSAVAVARFISGRREEAARDQAERALPGRMEGHAAMDMGVQGDGSVWARLASDDGRTAVARLFVMNWASVWTDIAGGLLVAGALAAWVPEHVWRSAFLADHPLAAQLIGPPAGLLVAVASSVCSVGNVPLAAVLWNGGMSFGGVIGFLFADLVIVPIVLIYRKYYGWPAAARLTAILAVAAVITGYVVEVVFGVAGLVPDERSAEVTAASISLDYTAVLNGVLAVVAVALVVRFVRSGSSAMLHEMGGSPA